MPGDSSLILLDADLWDFGLITSRMHMAWLRNIGGRLKSDYRYSIGIVYNPFPWPEVSDDKTREKIRALAQDRIAVEVQFGKYFAVSYDLFVKHLAFYVADLIDVGVEIVPMKSLSGSAMGASGKMQRQMSTGVPWYEKELYNLIREGRGVRGVPLVLIGVEA